MACNTTELEGSDGDPAPPLVDESSDEDNSVQAETQSFSSSKFDYRVPRISLLATSMQQNLVSTDAGSAEPGDYKYKIRLKQHLAPSASNRNGAVRFSLNCLTADTIAPTATRTTRLKPIKVLQRCHLRSPAQYCLHSVVHLCHRRSTRLSRRPSRTRRHGG